MENSQNNSEKENQLDKNYLEQLMKLKQTTVPKEEYERAIADNARLINALTSGSAPTGGDPQPPESDPERVKELRNKLFRMNSGMTNLEFVSTALELRTEIMRSGAPDPFLAFNHDHVPSEGEGERAQALADGLAEIVEYCNGDAKLFNSELQRVAK